MPLRPAVSQVTIAAPAKINLTLRVRGRREDGYHLLDSLVVFAGVGDTITAKPAKDLRLTMRGPFMPALLGAPENLVMRAARFLKSATQAKSGADLVLEKHLPVAAGVGGGSSDAAATLLACAKLWSVDLARFTDAQIAAALGADVPVCLRRRPAFMSGIGAQMRDAPPLPSAWFVLANPGEPLATKDVFNALAGRFSTDESQLDLSSIPDAAALAAALRPHGNDLAVPARELLPIIDDVIDAVERSKGCLLARLSGSGPTCFGLFGDEATARDAAESLRAAHLSWWVTAAPMLPAEPMATNESAA